VKYGFDNQKQIKEHLADSCSLAEINTVIMQMKSECLEYLKNKYIGEDK